MSPEGEFLFSSCSKCGALEKSINLKRNAIKTGVSLAAVAGLALIFLGLFTQSRNRDNAYRRIERTFVSNV